MNPLDITLINDPVNKEEYVNYTNCRLPKLFAGFSVKNLYDHKRFNIDSFSHKPKRVRIKSNNQDHFFYGIFLRPNQQTKKLIETVQHFELNSDRLTTERYKNILWEYNLTCNKCWRLHRPGIYPIDFNHLQNISNNKNIHTIFNNNNSEYMFDTTIDFTKFGSLHLLFFTKKLT